MVKIKEDGIGRERRQKRPQGMRVWSPVVRTVRVIVVGMDAAVAAGMIDILVVVYVNRPVDIHRFLHDPGPAIVVVPDVAATTVDGGPLFRPDDRGSGPGLLAHWRSSGPCFLAGRRCRDACGRRGPAKAAVIESLRYARLL